MRGRIQYKTIGPSDFKSDSTCMAHAHVLQVSTVKILVIVQLNALGNWEVEVVRD